MSAGDTLRGLVFRYRAACEDAATAREKLLAAETPSERERASERHGAATRIRCGIEVDILRRLCDGGPALDDTLAAYDALEKK